ncbi:hypothetical protein ONS95_000072 [Cadophora gregata]|uniref:uncharacterized protein n=1 Tax=Cadophora gregata TaxID=51156 RepID=UPI0026DB169A|nr:uncharacterized protein ONS95_000072 [Cadophora gregata]KAK0115658.1 hypothetical protein ONS96_014105 [Cadophora gregata f. sp. sojae]KAK0128088.1 hypothetical protein ONS95_000072 [Cadophora gregata]
MAKLNIFSAQHFKFGTDLWDPSHRFETSWLLPPWVLFGIRAAISLYAFTVTFFIIGWELSGHDGLSARDVRNSFSFFTILCYWGICFYFLISSIHTLSYALHGGTPLLNRFPRPLQALHSLFHTTITTFPLLVTIVYWAILFSSRPFPTTFALWSNISQHGLNSAFALFEILFTRINPAPWIHLLYLILLLACYLGLAYVTYATKGYYVYNFLNPEPERRVVNAEGKEENVGGVGKPAVVGYVFGIAVAICVIFCVVKGLTTLRKWLTETKMGRKGRFYAGRDMGYGDVELETQRVWEK